MRDWLYSPIASAYSARYQLRACRAEPGTSFLGCDFQGSVATEREKEGFHWEVLWEVTARRADDVRTLGQSHKTGSQGGRYALSMKGVISIKHKPST